MQAIEQQSYLRRILPYIGIAVAALILSLPSIGTTKIDDLDSAHHIMDGIFFRDVIVDLPVAHPFHYTLDYYKKYPALGFLFWPPFFPAVEGIAFLLGGI